MADASAAPSDRGLDSLRRASPWTQAALLAACAAFLAHAWHYAFLTDDAYISFRYAQNLHEGAGLVFNPGERVEGYTNFLWVLLLAGAAALGVAPHDAATPLSLAATAGLFLVCVATAARTAPAGGRAFAAVFTGVALALTPSLAIWSTGGLETRLFELLVFAGVARVLHEDAALRASGSPWPIGALLLSLASLTRPDGLLIAACVLGLATLWRPRDWRARLPWVVASAAVCAVVIGGHFLFRFTYYGEWLPNTYYAKVEGARLWPLGFRYLGAFVIEYGVWLWGPWLAFAGIAHRRRGSGIVPALFAAACLPHALYFVSVGGDHFEYRPFDLYFAFAWVAVAHGAAFVFARPRWRIPAGIALALSLPLCFELPVRAHLEFPDAYSSGFPAAYETDPAAAAYLDPARGTVYALPGLRSLAASHRDLVRRNARHFSALRRDEHARFVRTVQREGTLLRGLVEEGVLPTDTHLAICCVGAVPYLTRLPTLDRLGLTDATVARGPTKWPELLAHRKKATRRYARAQGVDFWSVDPVHVLFNARDPNLDLALQGLHEEGRDIFFAQAADDRYLLVELLQGPKHAQRKFPALEFRSTRDAEAVEAEIRKLRLRRRALRAGEAAG